MSEQLGKADIPKDDTRGTISPRFAVEKPWVGKGLVVSVHFPEGVTPRVELPPLDLTP